MSAADRLVGRTAELGVLEHALSELETRRPGAVLLSGEPGIGKTRLLAELAGLADAGGRLVLRGSASELERDLPFWIFVDALDEYLQSVEPHRLAPLGEDGLAELAEVFPAFTASASSPERSGDERYRSHRAVGLLLEQLAATKPLVLVFDDLQWADPGAIELLAALLRRPPAAPVLFVMAVRPRQAPELLSGAAARAEREGLLRQLELEPLGRPEALELLGDGVPARLAESICDEGEGNPFYLQQLARVAPEPARRPAESAVALGDVEIPRAVAAALADELALVPAGVRRVLEGAAVAGDPFEPELAAAATGIEEGQAMEALDELLDRDLVRATEVPRRFRFRHPLVRLSVYEAAPAGWRLGAHERTAAALAARGAPAAARALHVERSARHGDAEAVAVLEEAGQAALTRAPGSAARLLGAALRLLPADAPAEERAGLLASRAQASFACGDFRGALDAMQEAVELLPAPPVDMITACASFEHLLGRHAEATRRLEGTLDALDDTGSPEGVRLMLQLAIDGLYRLDYASMRDWTERGVAAARSLDIVPLTASALSLLALGASYAGSTRLAIEAADEAAQTIDSLDDDGLIAAMNHTPGLAAAEVELGRGERGEAHAERVLSVARATGRGGMLPVLFWAGIVRTARGRLADAAEPLETAVEIARLAGHAEGMAWNLCGRALAAVAEGDMEAALAHAEESVESVRGRGRSFPALWAGIALAAALVETGDPERALSTLEEAAGAGLADAPASWVPMLLELRVQAQVALGRVEDAAAAAAEARLRADELGTPGALGAAGRAEAVAHGTSEPALAAAAAFAEGAMPVEEGIARVLAGRALIEDGDRPGGAEELRRAASLFDACGAVRRRDAVERELGKLGMRSYHRSRKAEGEGVESLTERELEVARLIVDRKTNAQIAAELFLSPKTVETHVRHLFQKLDVSSRVEVAREIERADRRAG